MLASAFFGARTAGFRRAGVALAAVLAGALMLGVAAGRVSAGGAGEAPAQPRHEAHGGLVGVWQGTSLAICPGSLASRCNAQQKITLTLVEGDRARLGGFYKCAYGNMNCYNMNDTGKIIDATLTGALLRLRVLMPDGTSCMFNGRVAGNAMSGGYSCYTGGSLLERGSWRVQRAY